MPYIPIPPPMTGKGNNPSGSYTLTPKLKELIQRMIEFFGSDENKDKPFQFSLGPLKFTGNPDLCTREGHRIVKHLRGVEGYTRYGEDGREILNGIRECWIKAVWLEEMRK